MNKSAFLSAREAAAELGVSVATLYAYVSRGLVRSESEGNQRARRYHRADIEALKNRQEQRRNPGKAVEKALHWGTPVLESAISLITDGQLYYRGRSAVALATSATVEQVASLIWTGEMADRLPAARELRMSKRWLNASRSVSALAPIEAFQVLVPLAAVEDLSAYDLRPAAVAATGTRILQLMAAVATESEPDDKPIAAKLRRHWAANDARAEPLLSAALILSADHELNVSAFTARCVASAGSTPYAVVSAGLAALQGTKHGGYCERVEALFNEVADADSLRGALAHRLKRGEEIPGFGHTLYAQGDPRGAALLKMINQARPESAAVRLSNRIARAVHDLTGELPTIDLGLVTVARALKLPRGAALGLFALGRTIGWIGHAIEQYQTDRLIRPRARYVGAQPS